MVNEDRNPRIQQNVSDLDFLESEKRLQRIAEKQRAREAETQGWLDELERLKKQASDATRLEAVVRSV